MMYHRVPVVVAVTQLNRVRITLLSVTGNVPEMDRFIRSVALYLHVWAFYLPWFYYFIYRIYTDPNRSLYLISFFTQIDIFGAHFQPLSLFTEFSSVYGPTWGTWEHMFQLENFSFSSWCCGGLDFICPKALKLDFYRVSIFFRHRHIHSNFHLFHDGTSCGSITSEIDSDIWSAKRQSENQESANTE